MSMRDAKPHALSNCELSGRCLFESVSELATKCRRSSIIRCGESACAGLCGGWREKDGAVRRVVMHVRPFDLRPVPLGGRVVDHQQHLFWQVQRSQQKCYQLRGNRFALESHTGVKVVIVLKIVADARGAEPCGDHAPTAGEQHARQQDGQPPAIASMQLGG